MTVAELRKQLAAVVDADAAAAGYTIVLDFNGLEDLVDIEVRTIAIITKEKGTDKVTETPVNRLVLSA